MRTKQTRRKILKLLAMSFAVVLLLWNCKKDEAIPETTQDVSQKTNRFTTKKVKLASFEDNEKLMERLVDFKKKASRTSSVNARVLVDEQSGIAIDTDYVTYLEDSETNYHSYTFPVVNDTLGGVKNILLSLKEDGTYDEYLVTYDLTASEKQLLSIGQVADLNLASKAHFELLNTNFSNLTAQWAYNPDTGCYTEFEIIHHMCSENMHYASHGPCGADTYAWDEVVILWSICDGGGGTSGGSSSNNSGTNSTSGNASGGGGSSHPQTTTVPVYESPEKMAVRNYFNNLTPDQQDCLDANSGNFDPNNPSASTPSLESQIYHFLLANINPNPSLDSSGNPVPDPATEFTDEAIEEGCGGGAEDLNLIVEELKFLDKNSEYVESYDFVNAIKQELLNTNSTITKEQFTDLLIFFNTNDFLKKLKQSLAIGVTHTAEFTHYLYNKSQDYVQSNPSMLVVVNFGIQQLSNVVSQVTDLNHETASWVDLFNMWLFELGNNPINFSNNDAIISNLKIQEGVNTARDTALAQVSQSNFSPVDYQWTYGQQEFYDGMSNGNIATSFLGSYHTSINITQNTNGTVTLHFNISNTSGWASATRLRIDNDHNGQHDPIIPDKIRGQGVLLGGNFVQHWSWTEVH